MGDDDDDTTIIRLLSIPPHDRTTADIARLHARFRTIEGLIGSIVSGPTSAHRDAQLRRVCQLARHRRVPGDVLLYQAGEFCDSWFVLLTGSVLIETSMFLPRACFGTRVNGGAFRSSDCLVLEPSDLIVIPYEQRECASSVTDAVVGRQAVTTQKHCLSVDSSKQMPNGSFPSDVMNPTRHNPFRQFAPITMPRVDQSFTVEHKLTFADRHSQHRIGSDSSSVQSMGDTDSGRASSSYVSSEHRDSETNRSVKLARSPANQSMVDSEDEDDEDFESSSHESLRDAFWESVLKEPQDRTEDDIQILMENVQQLPAFSNLTKSTCRALCGVMVVAMVREAGQVVLGDEEPLDTWSVILNGTVEVVDPDGTVRELTRGDSFGVRSGRCDRVHHGVMRTVTEDCQFVCVPQSDYSRIMSREGEAEIPEVGEGGRVVLVYEAVDEDVVGSRSPAPNSTQPKKTRVVTKGTPEKLIEHLVADLSGVDLAYPEDFLLTYRTFLDSPRAIVNRLLSWHMHNPSLRHRVNRIVLLWVHNHFNDFEESTEMMRFVENFDRILATDGTAGERRLFQLACSTKARPRRVDLDLPVQPTGKPHSTAGDGSTNNLSVRIPFTLIGGIDGYGIFIDQVDPKFADAIANNSWNPSGKPIDPSAKPQALRRADQLLSINDRSVEQFTPSEVVHWIQSLGSMEQGGCVPSGTGSATVMGRPVCSLVMQLVYNPVQYHQLVSRMNAKGSHNTQLTQNSSESSNRSQSQTAYSIKLKTPTMVIRLTPDQITDPSMPSIHLLPAHAPNIQNPRMNTERLIGPVRNGWTRQGRGQERESIDADSRHFLQPDSSSSRSRSAHTSPTRLEANRPSVISVTENAGSQCLPVISDSRRTPSTNRLLISLPHLDHSHRSSSQPDLSSLESNVTSLPTPLPIGGGHQSEYVQPSESSVIRVWRTSDTGRDHSSKLILLPRRQTNALEATRLAVEEFGIAPDEIDAYSLYHVTVEPGPLVKQSRLSNMADDLAGRMTLNARYYLKHNRSHESLVSDELAKTILTESRVTFTQLVPEDLAIQLTLDDYEVFRAVQPTEYINEVFGLVPSTTEDPPSGYATGHDNLDRFTELVNREAYWVPTEVCQETNLSRRVELLKRFIKLTKFCRDLHNYNTMFCLLVGLHQTSVERLKQTWEKLPNKYHKLYTELSLVLDTSRNFSHYRSLLSDASASAPMLPYLPLILKDLTFIHLGNPSHTSDGLVNFVKLRMLAKEIRAVCRMCNVGYDLAAAQNLLRRSTGNRARTSKGSLLASTKSAFSIANGWESTASASAILLDELKRQDSVVEDHDGGSRSVGAASKRSGSVSMSAAAMSMASATGNSVGRRRTGSVVISGAHSNPPVQLNLKKMYESWLITLRIRTYFANLNVNMDVDSLAQMSTRLEPGARSTVIDALASPVSVKASADHDLNADTKSSTKSESTRNSVTSPESTRPVTTSISTPTSTASVIDTNVRPVLGAQSVEDARKLLALSECQKRSRHRVPAFTFPNAIQPQSHAARVIGLPQQPNATTSCAASHTTTCHNFHRPSLRGTTYTVMAGRNLWFDNLIPMPQRIDSVIRSTNAIPALPGSNYLHSRSPHLSQYIHASPSENPRCPYPTYFICPQAKPHSVNSNQGYLYPSANMHPLGLHGGPPIGFKHIRPQATHWKPNRPPPYELALSLRQQQSQPPITRPSSNVPPAHSVDEQLRQQQRAVESQSTSQTHLFLVRGPVDNPRANPTNQPSHSERQQFVKTAVAHQMVASNSRIQHRPSPPPYKQVVARFTLPSQSSMSTSPLPVINSPSVRPIPPSRVTASSNNHPASNSPRQIIGNPDKNATDPRSRR